MKRTILETSTYKEWQNVPEYKIGEIVSGELVISPLWSGWAHRSAHSGILCELFDRFSSSERSVDKTTPFDWQIFSRIDVLLHNDILVPDWAGWKRAIFGQRSRESLIDVAPQWVCEILSQESEELDRERKLPIYAREKVDHVWLIDPGTKTLEVYLRNDNRWMLLSSFAGNEVIRAAPFDAIEIDLGSLWLPDETGV